MKNDESSQVTKLNEEIQALKEKLLLQAPSVSSTEIFIPIIAMYHSLSASIILFSIQVDTSLLEEKHQQQLRDLEDAMKSTWEEKARISQAHESDRQLLLKEQAEAEKKLNLHQEKNCTITTLMTS